MDLEKSEEKQTASVNEKGEGVSSSEEKELGIEPDHEPPYSVFSRYERLFYAWLASVAAFASPVSTSIYYPALTVLAKDLNTSLGNINLTITTYMVCLSPYNTAHPLISVDRSSKHWLLQSLAASQTDMEEGSPTLSASPFT